MPRKPEPSFSLKQVIWDIAASVGINNFAAIYRELDHKIRQLHKNDELVGEEIPEERLVRRIIKLDIQRLLPEVVVDKLPRYIWHLRHDYEEIKRLADSLQARQHLPTEVVTEQESYVDDEILAFLERQEEQLEFFSIASLLKGFYVQTRDPTTEFTKPEVRQASLNKWRKRWDRINVREKAKLLGLSTIGNEVTYQRLRQANPDAEPLQAMRAYDESKLAFVEAFSSWITLVEITMEQGPQKEDAAGTRSSYTAIVGRLTDKLKKSSPDYWLYLRLQGLGLACQLVLLGIEGQVKESDDALWADESARVWQFWDDIIQVSVKLLPEPFCLADEHSDLQYMAESLWHIDDPVKLKTICLLEKRSRVNTAWKNLLEKANLWSDQ